MSQHFHVQRWILNSGVRGYIFGEYVSRFRVGLNSSRHLLNQFASWHLRKMLANIGPKGNSIVATSAWM